MAIQATPYMTFSGNCREAMSYYQQVLGGELMLQSVAETPIAAQCPTGVQNHIMHSMLTGDGFILMATDMTGPQGFIPGTDMSISLNFDKMEDINNCYERLSEGGKIIDTLKDSFWGSMFGVVQDKFGKVWMLNHEKKQS